MKIVKTKTSDGLYLNGLISVPFNKTKKIIINIHGMAGSALLNNFYPAMHDGYPNKDIAFLATEQRGTGMLTEFNSDDGIRIVGNAFEKFEECIFDIQAWVDFAKSEGYEEIWFQSHSLGNAKVAYYLFTKKPADISGTIFLSPSDSIGLVNDEVGIKDHVIMLPEAKRLVREGKGHHLIDHKIWETEYLSANTYLNFFDDGTNIGVFNYADESLGWKFVNAITIPVLAFTGTKDDGIVPVMDPYRAMEKLAKELKNSPRVKTVVFEGAEHSFDGFEDNIVSEVISFIKG